MQTQHRAHVIGLYFRRARFLANSFDVTAPTTTDRDTHAAHTITWKQGRDETVQIGPPVLFRVLAVITLYGGGVGGCVTLCLQHCQYEPIVHREIMYRAEFVKHRAEFETCVT